MTENPKIPQRRIEFYEKSMLIQLHIERARNRLHVLAEKHRGVQHPAVSKDVKITETKKLEVKEI